MKTFSLGEEWFAYLEDEIKETYGLTSIKYKVENKILTDRQQLIDWIDSKIKKNRWVQYKKYSKNVFDLKDYFPDPSSTVCKQIIDHFIYSCKTQTAQVVYFKFGDNIFNEKEIR